MADLGVYWGRYGRIDRGFQEKWRFVVVAALRAMNGICLKDVVDTWSKRKAKNGRSTTHARERREKEERGME
jgi:hypothetical protein